MWESVVVAVVYVVVVIWLIHIIPEKWKSTASLLFTIIAIILTVIFFKDDSRVITEIKASEARIVDSLKASESKIMDSQDTIKALLSALPDTSVSKSMRDSLLARMDSLNLCIDKHFASTRRRLIRIEEKLE